MICTDIPSYNIYRYGELVEMANDIKSLWQNDFVAFIIGCSFSFEQAMMNEGIPMHYIEKNLTVSMYLSSIETSPTGIFCGGTIVSMRPMTARNAIRAVEITSQLPHTPGSMLITDLPSQHGAQLSD